MPAIITPMVLHLPRAPLIAAEANDSDTVRLLDHLLEQALAWQASDIHFEVFTHMYRVRCRIDGALEVLAELPLSAKERITTRLKVMAQLDIAEKRLPQDGRIHYQRPQSPAVDIRISTLPTLHGEKVVLRLQSSSQQLRALSELGYPPTELQQLTAAIQQPHGMVLVTGPTGSGKTLSLYACLEQLNQTHRNIASVEDPCEIPIHGINQVHVNPKVGLDFATVLRALLRQDPDVLMVGEIRDLATADMAFKAAQTGHLVLSTLHTNSAVEAITRLRHMGVAPWQIAGSLQLVIAQRLVRLLCPSCKAPQTLSANQWQQLGGESQHPVQVYAPVGCSACHQGYRGRTGIFQALTISPTIQDCIVQEAPTPTLQHHAMQQGMRSLRQAGLAKVQQGLTSLQEVLAVSHG